MYVCQVAVKKLERAAEWAACWSQTEEVNGAKVYTSHARLWGSQSAARAHAHEVECCRNTSHAVVVKVVKGHRDELWISPHSARHMTVSEIDSGWFFAECFTAAICDEVRKVCDQTQDDVHTEATARP